MGCIFCDIVSGKIPADIVYENDQVLAFRDISPKAPVHVLIIPKKHIPNIISFTIEDQAVVQALFSTVSELATRLGVHETGFRVIANTGYEGGQTVDHFHFHVMGGRFLSWPPG